MRSHSDLVGKESKKITSAINKTERGMEKPTQGSYQRKEKRRRKMGNFELTWFAQQSLSFLQIDQNGAKKTKMGRTLSSKQG